MVYISPSLYIQSFNPITFTSTSSSSSSTTPPQPNQSTTHIVHSNPPKTPPQISNLAKKSTISLPSLPSLPPSHPTPPRKRMCLIHQIRCRCGHNGNIQTRCPDNPGRGFTPRCRAHGIRNTGRAPLAGASHSRTSRPPILAVPPPPLPLPSHQLPSNAAAAAAADRTQAGCPRCHEPIYLWGVGREMEALGM